MKTFEVIYKITENENRVGIIYASNILQAIKLVRSYCSINNIISIKEL